jgi:hypothetical protein
MEPPFSINLLTHLWRTFFISSLLKNHNLDFLKLVWNCHNAQVLIFAKDTKTFSTFLKVNYLWFSGHMLWLTLHGHILWSTRRKQTMLIHAILKTTKQPKGLQLYDCKLGNKMIKFDWILDE